MDQKLAEQKVRKPVKATTQNYKVTQIWKKLDKTSFENEKNEDQKEQKKGELYTKVAQTYEEKEGQKISRATIRRCVNDYINQNSQG